MIPPREIPVVVSDHARERMRERFPDGPKPARIFDEVRAGVSAGRLSATKPPGYPGRPQRETLYVRNETATRCYAVRPVQTGADDATSAFLVMTVVPLAEVA